MNRLAKKIVPHVILTIFSLVILMPLIWIVRVSLTDKLTAYKIPPEIGTLGLMNYVDIFERFPFVTWFANSFIVAIVSTVIALPLATAMAYSLRPPQHRRRVAAARRPGKPDAAADHPRVAAVRRLPASSA